MNNHQAFLSLILTAIALVTMPSYTHYKARKKNAAITATNTIRQQNNQQAEEVPEDSIAISYHILSKRECQQCFDNTNVIAKGLQPVYLTIVNNTKRTFTATGANSTIPYATAEEVTGRLRMSFVSMGTIAAKYCALSILAMPVFAITSQTFALSLVFGGPSFMALYLSPYACWAVAENIQSNKCNKQLLEKVEHQTLQEMVVNPKSTIEGLLFISRKQLPRKYRSNIIACQEYIKANFKITIIDQQTRDEFALSTNNPLLSLKQAIANR